MELMKRLNIQRKQDYLSDITLVSRDNIEFKAHRNVLSTASPFFDKLLRSNMKENRKGIVRLEEILGSVLKDVLEFIYTGTVDVTQENAEELIRHDRCRKLYDHAELENYFRAVFGTRNVIHKLYFDLLPR